MRCSLLLVAGSSQASILQYSREDQSLHPVALNLTVSLHAQRSGQARTTPGTQGKDVPISAAPIVLIIDSVCRFDHLDDFPSLLRSDI